MAYFASHADETTTIENLLNLYPQKAPIKIFTIYRILEYISKNLDFTNYVGTYYAAYKKREIQRIVEEYLKSILNKIITDYEILEVVAYQDPSTVGCVRIKLKYSVTPIGCTERGTVRTLTA